MLPKQLLQKKNNSYTGYISSRINRFYRFYLMLVS